MMPFEIQTAGSQNLPTELLTTWRILALLSPYQIWLTGATAMPSPLPQPARTRPWSDIARELTHESNPQRVIELSDELTRALDEQGIGVGQPRPSESEKEASAA
jgi:hypothetical protein